MNDPLFAKALVLKRGETTVVLITVDAVAIGEIGRIGNGVLEEVRGQLGMELHIPPTSVVIDASHCHGGVRIGGLKMVTFPGDLTVQVGLNIKKGANDPHAFVAGYTNGYIYYTPTAEQRNNTGYAQEDCDSLVAPEWQKIFESKSLEVLKKL